MADQDNILTKLHDLLLYVVPVLAKFPRDHKFTIGDRILLRLLDVQECCVMAYYGRDKAGPLTESASGSPRMWCGGSVGRGGNPNLHNKAKHLSSISDFCDIR